MPFRAGAPSYLATTPHARMHADMATALGHEPGGSVATAAGLASPAWPVIDTSVASGDAGPE